MDSYISVESNKKLSKKNLKLQGLEELIIVVKNRNFKIFREQSGFYKDLVLILCQLDRLMVKYRLTIDKKYDIRWPN